MKRLILILFLTLLTAGIAYATDLGPVGNPWPTIKVDYNESVTITDYNLSTLQESPKPCWITQLTLIIRPLYIKLQSY